MYQSIGHTFPVIMSGASLTCLSNFAQSSAKNADTSFLLSSSIFVGRLPTKNCPSTTGRAAQAVSNAMTASENRRENGGMNASCHYAEWKTTLDDRKWPVAELRSAGASGRFRCVAAAQNGNMHFASRAAAFSFSTLAANGRSQFLPVTGTGREYALAVWKSCPWLVC